jgi:hypothetical protein
MITARLYVTATSLLEEVHSSSSSSTTTSSSSPSPRHRASWDKTQRSTSVRDTASAAVASSATSTSRILASTKTSITSGVDAWTLAAPPRLHGLIEDACVACSSISRLNCTGWEGDKGTRRVGQRTNTPRAKNKNARRAFERGRSGGGGGTRTHPSVSRARRRLRGVRVVVREPRAQDDVRTLREPLARDLRRAVRGRHRVRERIATVVLTLGADVVVVVSDLARRDPSPPRRRPRRPPRTFSARAAVSSSAASGRLRRGRRRRAATRASMCDPRARKGALLFCRENGIERFRKYAKTYFHTSN